MPADALPAIPAPAPSWKMYRAMVGVGMACALMIVSVYQWTLPIITQKRAKALSAAVFQVIPGTTDKQAFKPDGDKLIGAGDAASEVIYAGFDDTGRLSGFAIPAEGMGYQDTIKLIYGYDAERQVIIGFRILESRETPGLGDRIGFDPVFLKNFEALNATVDAEGQVMHPIVAVKSGEKTEAWQVDGISGATVSSVAVAKILQTSVAKWAPLIQGQDQPFPPEAANGDD